MDKSLLDWLDLPIQPRVVFAQTPLTLALFQIQFTPMLNVANPASVAPFQSAIQDSYPVGAPPSHQVEIQFSGSANQAGMQSSLKSIVWRFSDLDDNWTVVLTTEFLTLETRTYSDFSDFLKRLERVLKAFIKHIRPTVGTRIGLRYINEIRPGHEDWASVIRPELLGPLGVAQFVGRAQQSLQQIILRDPSGAMINVHHGLVPAGTEVVRPRSDAPPPVAPFYVLDFDVYREFPQPGTLPMKAGVICKYVETYHEAVSRLFRWSVTEEYAATLGRRDDATG